MKSLRIHIFFSLQSLISPRAIIALLHQDYDISYSKTTGAETGQRDYCPMIRPLPRRGDIVLSAVELLTSFGSIRYGAEKNRCHMALGQLHFYKMLITGM